MENSNFTLLRVAISQIEAVQKAMENAGGYATLGQLYRDALRIDGADWSGTKTPLASIRRIVQTSGRFWKIRPGLWALNSQKDKIRALFEARDLAINFEASAEFDHGYYQGLLLEWGRFEGFETCVASDDRKRRFLEKPLAELASLPRTPEFTFGELVNRARRIDVAWFNRRGFPHSFFEVEHSTDIQNSLLKFLHFQDFRTQFYIVADDSRQSEWTRKMANPAFEVLQERVKFLSYESLAKRHTNAAQRHALQSL